MFSSFLRVYLCCAILLRIRTLHDCCTISTAINLNSGASETLSANSYDNTGFNSDQLALERRATTKSNRTNFNPQIFIKKPTGALEQSNRVLITRKFIFFEQRNSLEISERVIDRYPYIMLSQCGKEICSSSI